MSCHNGTSFEHSWRMMMEETKLGNYLYPLPLLLARNAHCTGIADSRPLRTPWTSAASRWETSLRFLTSQAERRWAANWGNRRRHGPTELELSYDLLTRMGLSESFSSNADQDQNEPCRAHRIRSSKPDVKRRLALQGSELSHPRTPPRIERPVSPGRDCFHYATTL